MQWRPKDLMSHSLRFYFITQHFCLVLTLGVNFYLSTEYDSIFLLGNKFYIYYVHMCPVKSK